MILLCRRVVEIPSSIIDFFFGYRSSGVEGGNLDSFPNDKKQRKGFCIP